MDSQGGSEKMMAGSNTTHKKRNTRMHMRLGPNTSWGAHTAPHPTPLPPSPINGSNGFVLECSAGEQRSARDSEAVAGMM